MRVFLYLFVLCACQYGCMTRELFEGFESYEKSSTNAELYLMRSSSFAFFKSYKVEVNGEPLAKLKAKSFVRLELEPGEYLFAFPGNTFESRETVEVLLNVESGKRYFLDYQSIMKKSSILCIFCPTIESVTYLLLEYDAEFAYSLLGKLKELKVSNKFF